MKLSAHEHLKSRDPIVAQIVTGGAPFKISRNADLYTSLIASIMSQQLSVKAADTIHGRFLDLFPARDPRPERVLALSVEQLRAAGVSRQKAGYIQNVATFALQNDITHAALKRMTDDEIIALLTQIKGVGRWTVEMLLMFPLNRPDVFPADDLGIQTAMKKLYNLRATGPALRKKMTAIAENWRPHRTLVCKHLWRWKSAQ